MPNMTPDELAFRATITQRPHDATARLDYAAWLTAREKLLLARIRTAMKALPTLTTFGIEVYHEYRGDARRRQIEIQRGWLTNQGCDWLPPPTAQFADCLAWLVGRQPIKTCTRSSYALKYDVEKCFDRYTCNGIFIAAGVWSDIPYKAELDNPNVYFGIAKASLREPAAERRKGRLKFPMKFRV